MAQEHDDYADPNLPPSRAPTLGTVAGWVVLGVLFLLMMVLSWSRYW